MVAQAAVGRDALTVTDGKAMHSMHSYFMRPVDIGAEVRYEVEVLRDGRGYSTRQVRGFQNGKPVYVCLASFAAGEPGGSFQAATPADVPAPETLPSSAAYLAGPRPGGTMTEESKAYWSGGRSFDMRHVPGPVYLEVEGERAPAPGGLGQAVRRAAPGRRAHRRPARPRRARLRLRLHDPRAGAARARPALGRRGPGHREPRPRDVVPPARSVLDGWLLYAQEAVVGRGRPRRRPSAASSPPTASTCRDRRPGGHDPRRPEADA